MNRANIDIGRLSDFQVWRAANGEGFTLLDYLYGVASIEMAIAFTKLFWPDLVEHDGSVFLYDGFSQQTYDQWRASLGDDGSAIEQIMNHRHIADLLPGAAAVGPENLRYLGETIGAMWEARLAQLYPTLRFRVLVGRDEDDADVTITVSQVRD